MNSAISSSQTATLKDCQQMFSFFMKLSSFTRYQLDEVLPSLISKSHFVIPDEVAEECDVLLISVRTFIQLMKVVQKRVKESQTLGGVVELWRDVLYEMYTNINPTTGTMEKKGHYCGLCNYHSFCSQEWNEHLRNDKVHLERNNLALLEANRVEGTYCKFCGVILYSEQIHLDLILNSEDHKALDSKVRKIEANKTMSNDLTAKGNSSASTSIDVPTANSNNLKCNERKDFHSSTSSMAGSRMNDFNPKGRNWSKNKNKEQTNNFKKKKNLCDINLNHEEKFRTTVISEEFEILNSRLSSNQCAEGHYCRPCGMIFEKKRDWKNHCSNVNHQSGNTISTCEFCKMSFLVFKMHAGDYMGYHLKKCHPERSLRIYESKNNLRTKNAQQWQSENDLSMNSNRAVSTFGGSLADLSSNISHIQPPMNLLQSSPVPSQEISPQTSTPNSLMNSLTINAYEQINPKFFEILEAKKFDYDTTKIMSFKGLCLNCDIDFSCQFEWISHFDSHEIKVDEEILECQKCNLGIFGNKEMIERFYLQHPDHIALDEYIQS
ncbi:uncharacterized protein LOC106666352 isoform X4 [Cimex lectularius]|nr:uncharacterized protein LOC106666352 isoform X4 [Cimex lectularius]XP_014248969.1 uncharacterized protein LOC106666352 isoform X4 [Cimex lectularius]